MPIVSKGAPFRYNGAINVENCQTAEEVIKKANLDWSVEKCPIFGQMPLGVDRLENDCFIHDENYYAKIPNAYGIYRTDLNIPLGIVKDRYNIVQNIDAFAFFNDAIGKDKAIWQTAGYFGNGERVFVSAKIPKSIFVEDDPVENYLVFTTSHDGSSGVKILFTPIRIVCQNTLNAAIRESSNYISFRHTDSVHDNIRTVTDIIKASNAKVESLAEAYNAMRKVKITDNKAMEYFNKLILSEAEIENLRITGHTYQEIIYKNYQAMCDANISTKKVNVISSMYDYYHGGIGQKDILGSGWGLYNAVSGYYSNIDNAVGLKRMDSLLYGDKSKKIQKAGDIVLDMIKSA